jgi:hypothetical protein
MGSHALIATYPDSLPASPCPPESRRDGQDPEHEQGNEKGNQGRVGAMAVTGMSEYYLHRRAPTVE